MFIILSLLFMGEGSPGVGGYQHVFQTLTSFLNSVLLFLRETFPGVGWKLACLSTLTSVQKLKILFQISLTAKWHFDAKGLWANHLTFSFSHYSIRSQYLSDLDSFLCSTDCRSYSAGSWLLFIYHFNNFLPTPPLWQDMTQGQFLSNTLNIFI